MKELQPLMLQGEIIRLRNEVKIRMMSYVEMLNRNATLGERKCVRTELRQLVNTIREIEIQLIERSW